MRIVHALHSFPPESFGGTESYVAAIAAEQTRRGHDVTIAAGSDAADTGRATREDTVDGIRVFRLPPPSRDPISLDGVDPTTRDRLLAWLRGARPDIVHVHHWHNLSSDLLAALGKLGIAAVVSLHDLFATCPLFFRLPDNSHLCDPEVGAETCARCVGRFLKSPVAALATAIARRHAVFRNELASAGAVLCLSEPQRRYLGSVPSLAEIRLDVVAFPRLPMPPTRRPAPERRDSARHSLVSWGGLVPGKGLHRVLDACESSRHAARIRIDHFGRVLDVNYARGLEASAHRTELRLRGPYDKETLASEIANYDCAVFPSLFLETHGVAVDEALALGIPVLVFDRGAPKDRVGGRGIVVSADDPEALRGWIERWIDDPAILDRMRRAPDPPHATVSQHCDGLEGVYADARRRPA